MWLNNIKEIKKKSGLTNKQIAERANLPEQTVNRIFSGATDHPRIDTLALIVEAMDSTMRDIFADTNIVVATQCLVEIKETAEAVEAEREVAIVKNDILESKVATLEKEIALLKLELQHKDELLAVHNYYISLNKTNSNCV